jgi:hypothetical protein
MSAKYLNTPGDIVKMQKALNGNLKKYLENKKDYDYMEIRPTSDITKWYILYHNLAGADDEFVNGEFIIELEVSPTFPATPPSLKVLTHTGIFEIGKNVCLSIGSYHPGSFPAAIGILGYCGLVYSSFIGWKDLQSGISIISRPSVNDIKKASKNSVKYNRDNYPNIMMMFGDFDRSNSSSATSSTNSSAASSTANSSAASSTANSSAASSTANSSAASSKTNNTSNIAKPKLSFMTTPAPAPAPAPTSVSAPAPTSTNNKGKEKGKGKGKGKTE